MLQTFDVFKRFWPEKLWIWSLSFHKLSVMHKKLDNEMRLTLFSFLLPESIYRFEKKTHRLFIPSFSFSHPLKTFVFCAFWGRTKFRSINWLKLLLIHHVADDKTKEIFFSSSKDRWPQHGDSDLQLSRPKKCLLGPKQTLLLRAFDVTI